MGGFLKTQDADDMGSIPCAVRRQGMALSLSTLRRYAEQFNASYKVLNATKMDSRLKSKMFWPSSDFLRTKKNLRNSSTRFFLRFFLSLINLPNFLVKNFPSLTNFYFSKLVEIIENEQNEENALNCVPSQLVFFSFVILRRISDYNPNFKSKFTLTLLVDES